MSTIRRARGFAAAFVVVVTAFPATAAGREELPFLHPLFTDHMVVQRDAKFPVWGWTDPGREVEVRLGGQVARATAGADGKWVARIGPLPAGGPHELAVDGPDPVVLEDVLVGDVWICSGQSNMQWSVQASKNAEKEIAGAEHPRLRLFTVPRRVALEPEKVVDGEWQVCSPETVPQFSAVGYFFGRDLHKAVKAPIGLIHTSWGGTVAEAWTSAEALETLDEFKQEVARFRKLAAARRSGRETLDEQMAAWWRRNDPGSAGDTGWAATDVDTSSWKKMNLPQNWEKAVLPGFDGVVWFRKEFMLPSGWAGEDLELHLGPIDDRDTTWINGVQVGAENEWNRPRRYKVPASVVKTGRNVIAVRVLDTGGAGGIYGEAGQMRLELPGGDGRPLPLAGEWLYNASVPLSRTEPVPVNVANNPNVTTVLYNAMIAPLVPFAIRGAIWYQGESNAGRPLQYRSLLPALIRDWRSRFGVGDFPFLVVQLANFMAPEPQPGESNWAELREAQSMTAAADPKTAVVVTIDIGEANDIHPRNKQGVGRRLALAARALAHGEEIVHSGPTYRGMEVRGRSIHLSFDHVGGGLVARGDGKLEGFAIAGAGGKFVWADAVIEGDKVIVSAPGVDEPVAVRYAWANNPICNLYNKEGLPASPFRTDAER